jgi:hypothetical protein
MSSVENNDMTCQISAQQMACDAMISIAKETERHDRLIEFYRNARPLDCERYGQIRDTTLEMKIIGASFGLSRNPCAVPPYSEFAFVGPTGGDIGNNPQTMFLERTRRGT